MTSTRQRLDCGQRLWLTTSRAICSTRVPAPRHRGHPCARSEWRACASSRNGSHVLRPAVAGFVPCDRIRSMSTAPHPRRGSMTRAETIEVVNPRGLYTETPMSCCGPRVEFYATSAGNPGPTPHPGPVPNPLPTPGPFPGPGPTNPLPSMEPRRLRRCLHAVCAGGYQTKAVQVTHGR